MRHTTHFDPVTRSLLNRHHVEALSESGEPIFERAQAIDADIDECSIHLYPVLLETKPVNLDRIRMVPIAQLDGIAGFAANLWPTAQGRSIELCLLHPQFSVAGFDRGLQKRDVGMLPREVLAFDCQTIQPADINFPTLHFVAA